MQTATFSQRAKDNRLIARELEQAQARASRDLLTILLAWSILPGAVMCFYALWKGMGLVRLGQPVHRQLVWLAILVASLIATLLAQDVANWRRGRVIRKLMVERMNHLGVSPQRMRAADPNGKLLPFTLYPSSSYPMPPTVVDELIARGADVHAKPLSGLIPAAAKAYQLAGDLELDEAVVEIPGMLASCHTPQEWAAAHDELTALTRDMSALADQREAAPKILDQQTTQAAQDDARTRVSASLAATRQALARETALHTATPLDVRRGESALGADVGFRIPADPTPSNETETVTP